MSDQHVGTDVRRRDRTLSFDQNHATKSRTRKSRLSTQDDDSGLSLNLRTAFRFGTWNVLSVSEQGCDHLVVRKLSRFHLFILPSLRVRWPGSGTKTVANSTMLRSDNKRTEGVALALDPSASRALISWRPISERLLTATFKHRHGRLQVIACYAPTNSHIDANKDQFYNTLTDLIVSFARHDIVVVLGDLNATLGSDRRGYESVLGPHSSGSRNDNSERRLDLCALHRLKITGSWFRRQTCIAGPGYQMTVGQKRS